jgi:DNA-binding response OmpR family regulator
MPERRILLVEDDPNLAPLLEHILVERTILSTSPERCGRPAHILTRRPTPS